MIQIGNNLFFIEKNWFDRNFKGYLYKNKMVDLKKKIRQSHNFHL